MNRVISIETHFLMLLPNKNNNSNNNNTNNNNNQLGKLNPPHPFFLKPQCWKCITLISTHFHINS